MHSMMSTFQSTPIKGGRRVLGEKPTNACLSPATMKHNTGELPTRWNLLSTFRSPQNLASVFPFNASRKRTIDQVEGSETADVPAAVQLQSAEVRNWKPNDASMQLFFFFFFYVCCSVSCSLLTNSRFV